MKKTALVIVCCILCAALLIGSAIAAVLHTFEKPLPESERRAEAQQTVEVEAPSGETVPITYAETVRQENGAYRDQYEAENGDLYVLDESGTVVGYEKQQALAQQESGEKFTQEEIVSMALAEIRKRTGTVPPDVIKVETRDDLQQYNLTIGTLYGKDHLIRGNYYLTSFSYTGTLISYSYIDLCTVDAALEQKLAQISSADLDKAAQEQFSNITSINRYQLVTDEGAAAIRILISVQYPACSAAEVVYYPIK